MAKPLYFQNAPLEDMVALGATGPDNARVWLRSQRPGAVTLRWTPEHGEGQGSVQGAIAERNDTDNTATLLAQELRPLTRYRYEVIRDDGSRIGGGRFETAPNGVEQTPKRFSFGLMSCNLPFDRKGRVHEEAGQMLRAARDFMERHETRFALMVGDQMYSDYPVPLSLFNRRYFRTIAPPGRGDILQCSPEEVRAIFQRRYRHFWNQPAWMEMQANVPCYPILDDHDIVDNWGSVPAHQTEKWRALGLGARASYFDYQGSRVLGDTMPASFHYSFQYGNAALFVMDLRSQRSAGPQGQLYDDAQQRDFEKFLQDNAHLPALFIVLSVPVVHLPRFIARAMAALPRTGEDFSDRWSSGAHVRDRDRLLSILHAHQKRTPQQRVVLLSGDIHIGCVHVIQWDDGAPPLHQVISSPITHHTSRALQWASKALIRMNRRITTLDGRLSASVRPLPASGEGMYNPLGGLNMGLVEVNTPEPGATPSLRLLFYGHEQGKPALRFDSGEL